MHALPRTSNCCDPEHAWPSASNSGVSRFKPLVKCPQMKRAYEWMLGGLGSLSPVSAQRPIYVAVHGTSLSGCFPLGVRPTLKLVAQHFQHDTSRHTILVKMRSGEFSVVPLDLPLSRLRQLKADGDGSQDRPFCVLIERSGAVGAGAAGAEMGAAGGADTTTAGTSGAGAGASAAAREEDLPFTGKQIAVLEQWKQELMNPPRRLQVSQSYAASYDGRKRCKLTIPQEVSAVGAPPVDFAQFFRANINENSELLPRVLSIMKTLPEAEFRVKAVNERDAVLYNGLLIVDTHTLPYLGGCAPDLTLVRNGCSVSPTTVLALLELQTRAIDTTHKGKMEHSLMAALEAMPDRHLAKGAVFNGADVIFYEARREDGKIVMYESEQLTLSTGANWVWEHFWEFLLSGGRHQRPGGSSGGGSSGNSPDDWEQLATHYGWNPPKLYAESASGSGAALLQPKGLIASDGQVEVWEVERDSQQAVCKYYKQMRLSSYGRELTALRAISAATPGQGRRLWPQLLSVGASHIPGAAPQRLLLTRPLAGPMGTMTYGRLCELLDGYAYLHQTVGYVHRDLEDKHVGLADDQLCVFDLSTSAPLTPPPHPDREGALGVGGYSGTIINASDDVLDALAGDTEVPARKQQDLVALVKTVYALTHADRLQRIRKLAHPVAVLAKTGLLAEAVVRVRKFWESEFSNSSPAGARWRALVQTAHVETNSSAYSEVVQTLRQQLGELVCPCQ